MLGYKKNTIETYGSKRKPMNFLANKPSYYKIKFNFSNNGNKPTNTIEKKHS